MNEDDIQAATKAYRAEVDGWSESRVRKEGADLGIPGSDTAPVVTLREAIVQRHRDSARAEVAHDPQLPSGPGPARTDRRLASPR